MSKFIAKTNNKTALFLSNFYSTFETSIANIAKVEHSRVLTIKNDPISTQHVLVSDLKHPNHVFRIETHDIEQANQNRQSLYHLLATTLDYLKV